jgi:AraC-like DNA-binding protein
MHCFEKQLLNSEIYDTPLPLSSARDDSALLASFSGLFHAAWPCMHVVALEGPPTIAQLKKRPWLSLIYVYAGEITFSQHNSNVFCSAGDCFFIPQGSALWESSGYNIVNVSLAPEKVLVSLNSISAGELASENAGKWDLSKPSCIRSTNGNVEASMLSTLHHLLAITNELTINHPNLQTHLGIENQLSFLTALVACPELNDALLSEKKVARTGGTAEAINDLVKYMLSHLSEPLNLAILEQYSHYSRRSLQYAFRQRFGCTITQWIRAERLDLAFQKLKTARLGDSVASIARSCGYRSFSLFSIEFQNRFHIKPSVMLRKHQTNYDPARGTNVAKVIT